MSTERGTTNPFETALDRTPANYAPLTPLTFIERAASVWPDHLSVIDGERRFTWAGTYARCRRLASALAQRGIGAGDCVAVFAPNVPAIYEASFGVPMLGAVLNTINVRLDPATVAFILEHGEAKALLTDRELSPVIADALARMERPPLVIDVDDARATGGERIGAIEYEAFLEEGDPGFEWSGPDDEWRAISLNYTSGTTGNPKGVVYHHRGAYLNALSNVVGWNLAHHPVYLWTLPMFHCNGWCFPWTLAAVGGTSVCARRVEAGAIYGAIAGEGVTHLCGAPVVLGMILNAGEDERRPLPHPVHVMTAAAPPPAAVLERMEREGFKVTHVYGLTETYGPAVICAWKKEWDDLPMAEQAERKSRQGVRYHALDALEVMDPGTMTPVPRDGRDPGRGDVPRQRRDEGLSQEPGRHRGGVRGRLVPLRRPRGRAPRRLRPAQGPVQGRHHLGRGEHLLDRGRGRPLPPPGGAGGCRRRPPRREMGRDPLRLRDPARGGGRDHRRRRHRLLPRPSGALQGAADGGVRPFAEDLDRQDPEVQAARARRGAVSRRRP